MLAICWLLYWSMLNVRINDANTFCNFSIQPRKNAFFFFYYCCILESPYRHPETRLNKTTIFPGMGIFIIKLRRSDDFETGRWFGQLILVSVNCRPSIYVRYPITKRDRDADQHEIVITSIIRCGMEQLKNGYTISSHPLRRSCLLIYAGIKVYPY